MAGAALLLQPADSSPSVSVITVNLSVYGYQYGMDGQNRISLPWPVLYPQSQWTVRLDFGLKIIKLSINLFCLPSVDCNWSVEVESCEKDVTARPRVKMSAARLIVPGKDCRPNCEGEYFLHDLQNQEFLLRAAIITAEWRTGGKQFSK